MNKTIAILILFLCIFTQAVFASQPSCPEIDEHIITQVKRLSYIDSEQDISNLEQIKMLYMQNGKDCLTMSDSKLFTDTISSYPNEFILKYFLLNDGTYDDLNINNFLIRENEIDDAIPYLIDYLEVNLDTILRNTYDWNMKCDLLGDFGSNESNLFLRERLFSLDELHRTRRDAVIRNIGKLRDFESYEPLLKYCKTVVLNKEKDDSYASPFQSCLKALNNYQRLDFIEFIMNQDNYYYYSYYRAYMFPSFALNESIYLTYTKSVVSTSKTRDELVIIWDDWYSENKNNLIWDEELEMFIENGTKDQIMSYLQSSDSKEISLKKIGFFSRLRAFFINLF